MANPLRLARVACLLLTAFSFQSIAQVLDPTFTPPLVLRQGFVSTIKPAPDGKLYVGGEFDYFGTQVVGDLVRLTSTGYLDPTFKAELPSGYDFVTFEVLANGNLLVLLTGTIAGHSHLLLLSSGGQMISSLEADIMTVEPLPDGRFLAGDAFGSVWRYSPTLVQDPNFRLSTNDHISDIERLGSKVYVCGGFTQVYDGPTAGTMYERISIARFNMDGTVDQTFNANNAIPIVGDPKRMMVQPDGKVVPLDAAGASRLNSNGSVDSGFNFGYRPFVIEDAYYVSGKITALSRNRILRVNYDGSVDSSFQPIVFDPTYVKMFTFTDNSVIAANLIRGTYGMAMYNSAGIKQSYNAQLMRYGIINAMDRTSTTVYIAGDFIRVNGHMTRNVARLNPNGSVLAKFRVTTLYQPVNGIEAFADARSIISTPTTMYRLSHDGTFDPSFKYINPGLPTISKFIVQNDGKILAGGPSKIFRLNNNGSRDLSFNAAIGGISEAYFFDFDLDRATGKIIFTGQFAGGSSPQTNNLTRLNPNGSIDNSFQAQFPSQSPSFPQVIFLPNLQVLFSSFYSYRYNDKLYIVIKGNSDGSVNSEFLNNYVPESFRYGNFDRLHRFGDRVIMSANYFYGQRAFSQVIFYNGVIDNAFAFPSGMVIDWLANFYSDNNHELFVVGQITPTQGARKTSIVKLLHHGSTATTASSESGESASRLSFYPNPAQSQLTIESQGQVKIFDQYGQKWIEANLSGTSNTLDLTTLPPGRYVIQIDDRDKTLRKHFVKE